MNELTNILLNHLATTSREELDKEWEELKESNSIGYLVSDLAELILSESQRQITTNQNISTTYLSPDDNSLDFFYSNNYYGSCYI